MTALLRRLSELLPAREYRGIERVTQRYSLSITQNVMETMHDLNPEHDPVAKQYIPDLRELDEIEGELDDPTGDFAHEAVKGLIHRYPDRVLFKVTPICAVYCRFCFRREMVGVSQELLNEDDYAKVYAYIAENPQIREVILSGGDPLVLSARRLKKIMEHLSSIEHVQRIRIHTRVPVAAPARVDAEMMTALATPKKTAAVIHINHPNELTQQVQDAVKMLQENGWEVLSQSVLLNGVNNDSDILRDLFEGLIQHDVKPYYLHHPDKANGTKHFRISIEEGKKIYTALRGTVSGYALPQYVLDIPGGYGKVPVNSDWIEPHAEGGYSVLDIHGNRHRYYD